MLQARRDAAIEKRGGRCKLVNTESAFVSVTTMKGAGSLMTRKGGEGGTWRNLGRGGRGKAILC